ncbi:MAG: M67 family metallopeptidase [Candidatus Omnitrophota bacterium]|nr:M67 family metallopeptidase [Candidatus Omnitrophota bacterium]
MSTVEVSENFLKQIIQQAEAEYPNECCGMILGPKSQVGNMTKLRPCRNVQDDYHQKDPEIFKRDAKAAYFIDPRELLEIQKEARESGEEIRVIYHSHINVGAYFSDEDKRAATAEGEPVYPGVAYLVVSVVEGKAKGHNTFTWNDERKDFIS